VAIGKHYLKNVAHEIKGHQFTRKEWYFRLSSNDEWLPYKYHQDSPSNHRRMNEVFEMAIMRLAEKVDAEVMLEASSHREAFLLITFNTKMPVRKLLRLLSIEIELATEWKRNFLEEARPPSVAEIIQQCQDGHC
jgi:hypothetical protein